jgi:hypothetical protein
VIDALAHRDGKALAALTAPGFVLHIAGKPDTDRQTFLAAAVALEGEILSVDGADLNVVCPGRAPHADARGRV